MIRPRVCRPSNGHRARPNSSWARRGGGDGAARTGHNLAGMVNDLARQLRRDMTDSERNTLA